MEVSDSGIPDSGSLNGWNLMGKRWTEEDLKNLRPGMVPEMSIASTHTQQSVEKARENVQVQNKNIVELQSPISATDYVMIGGTAQKNCRITIKKTPKALTEIMAWLRILKISYETEHRFHPKRRWRFDVAIVEQKIAIEYEGIVSEDPDGQSRHTNIRGYTKDATKYNAAQKLGWRVLRYTALNYEEFMNDITEILNITEA